MDLLIGTDTQAIVVLGPVLNLFQDLSTSTSTEIDPEMNSG